LKERGAMGGIPPDGEKPILRIKIYDYSIK
jgi:hypothetical protein